MPEHKLENIFIRCRELEPRKPGEPYRKNTERWEMYSFRELLDDDRGGEIFQWFLERIMRHCNYEEGDVITEENVRAMLAILDAVGIPPVEVK